MIEIGVRILYQLSLGYCFKSKLVQVPTVSVVAKSVPSNSGQLNQSGFTTISASDSLAPASSKQWCSEHEFRCWPVDLDFFMHMNNAKYLRVAELSRWRLMPETGILKSILSGKGMLFLATDQRALYFRPIQPFQRYVVRSNVNYLTSDDKWLYYTHTFLQHPSSVPAGKEPVKYAEVYLKAVVKEPSGKTIRPSHLATLTDTSRLLMTPVTAQDLAFIVAPPQTLTTAS